jgi:hypothetical protein
LSVTRPRPSLPVALAALLAFAGASPAAAAPRAWSQPVAVTPAAGPGQVFHDAVLALNAAGDAVVGWQRDNANCCSQAGTIQVRGRSGPRGAWGRVATLSKTPGSALLLAINDRGEAVAAWSEADGVHVMARNGLTGAWMDEALPAPAPSGVIEGGLTLDAAGRAVLTLVTTTPGAVVVRTLHRSAPGQPWQSAPDHTGAGVVHIAVATSGAAVAASSPSGGAGIVSRRDPVSLAWDVAVPLVPPGASRVAPGVNDRGDAIVAWTLPGASGAGAGLPGLTQIARRAADAPVWTGPATVGTIPGLLATASLNVSGQGLLTWATQLPEQGNAVVASYGEVRLGTWTESVAASLSTEVDVRAALDDRGRAVAVLHGHDGPGGRGTSYGLVPAGLASWGAQEPWTDCRGFTPALAVNRPTGRAVSSCEAPEDGRPITVRSLDDLGPLALAVPARLAPGARLQVRFSSPVAGSAVLSVVGGGRVLATLTRDVKQGYGLVALTAPGSRGRYSVRVVVRAVGRQPVSDRANLLVR